MPRSYWLPAIALGLALAGAANAQPIRHHTSRNTGPAQAETKPSTDAKPSELVAVQNDLQRIARALEAANSKQQASDEKYRAEQDLHDQNEMARWAKWMFWDGIGETILTIIGVFLIWRTLIHTRKGAEAAASQVRIMRDASEDQLRPYVFISAAEYWWQDSRKFIRATCTNGGQTPATYIEIGCFSKAVDHVAHFARPIHNDLHYVSWSAVERDSESVQILPATIEADTATVKAAGFGKMQLFVLGRVKYGDVFGNEYESEFVYFINDPRYNAIAGHKMSRATGKRVTFVMTKKTESNNQTV